MVLPGSEARFKHSATSLANYNRRAVAMFSPTGQCVVGAITNYWVTNYLISTIHTEFTCENTQHVSAKNALTTEMVG